MDANKLLVLKELPYKIQPVCALCKHSLFPNDYWGYCNNTTYAHKKHTESTRQLSINKFGSCPSFASASEKVSELGTFVEFANFEEEDPSVFECESCSKKPGTPHLCDRCLTARAAAGNKWKGPRRT